MPALALTALHRPVRRPRRPTPSLRPARAEDAPALSAYLQRLSVASRRLRFHGHLDPQSPALVRQLCEVDGVRHRAWLAWAGHGDAAVVVGEARFVCVVDANGIGAVAELAISVADEWQGSGLADVLLQRVIDAAARAGVRHLFGDVMAANPRMQSFMCRHGFEADLFACGRVLRMARTPMARPLGRIRAALDRFAASRQIAVSASTSASTIALPARWAARVARSLACASISRSASASAMTRTT